MAHLVSAMDVAPQWLKQIREALRAVWNREIEEDNCFEVFSLEEVPQNHASFLSKDEEEFIYECAGYICAHTNETDVHFCAKAEISRAVNSAANDGRGQFISVTGKMPVLKLFSCGDVREIEYAHLDLAGLLEESIFLLTEYTTPRYCVAVKIFPDQEEFRCIVFVLERLEENVFDPHKRASIQEKLESNKPQKGKCIKKIDFSQIDLFDPNVNRNLREFGVNMVFLKEILEANLEQDVTIALQAYRNPIVLPSRMFINLRNLHHERWNDLHAEQEE